MIYNSLLFYIKMTGAGIGQGFWHYGMFYPILSNRIYVNKYHLSGNFKPCFINQQRAFMDLRQAV